ncbi:MAG: diaminopimelate epimerase [Acidimicrobiaceae bacterium]|nr:diaminopimelate epimerase [Acidimicrobiaceae bacterium]MBT5205515.1 diaminopimelate epimerase [Acidimicrobiaceae bacterium]MBT5569407.1 diaminopimelate epimerase [Acidimicrobiaceae bacterium]MBT6092215.1 diaminopimelate epimerase [Acidimicrobiaceae bacterium]
MKLTRHHGLGNDFLITFADDVPANGADLARRLCDRVDGIGADGLVFGTPVDGLRDATWRFTLFNSDGSSAEVSGNGLRCFGQALLRRQPAGTTGLDVVVETPAGDRRITVAGSTSDLEVEAEVEMGTAERGPSIEGIRVDLGGVQVRAAHSIDFGNPHLVLHVDDPDEVDLAVSGPATESFFAPTGCNVHLVAVVDRSTVRMRTWERGAGLTTACGSGACAAAHVLHAGSLVDDVVEVRMPGGTATVTVGDTVRLAGTATFVDVHSVDLPADHFGVLGNGGPDNG